MAPDNPYARRKNYRKNTKTNFDKWSFVNVDAILFPKIHLDSFRWPIVLLIRENRTTIGSCKQGVVRCIKGSFVAWMLTNLLLQLHYSCKLTTNEKKWIILHSGKLFRFQNLLGTVRRACYPDVWWYILPYDNAFEGRQSTLDVSRDLSLPKRFRFTGLLKQVVEVFIWRIV